MSVILRRMKFRGGWVPRRVGTGEGKVSGRGSTEEGRFRGGWLPGRVRCQGVEGPREVTYRRDQRTRRVKIKKKWYDRPTNFTENLNKDLRVRLETMGTKLLRTRRIIKNYTGKDDFNCSHLKQKTLISTTYIIGKQNLFVFLFLLFCVLEIKTPKWDRRELFVLSRQIRCVIWSRL